MMIRQITQINWRYIGDVLPSFVVMTFIPFSYSVAYGLIAYVPFWSHLEPRSQLTSLSGVFIYATLNGLIGLVVFLSGGLLEPREYDLKEYWTWKGSGRAPWFVRAIRRRQGHHEPEDVDETDYPMTQSQDPGSSLSRSQVSSGKEESMRTTDVPMTPTPGGNGTGRWAI